MWKCTGRGKETKRLDRQRSIMMVYWLYSICDVVLVWLSENIPSARTKFGPVSSDTWFWSIRFSHYRVGRGAGGEKRRSLLPQPPRLFLTRSSSPRAAVKTKRRAWGRLSRSTGGRHGWDQSALQGRHRWSREPKANRGILLWALRDTADIRFSTVRSPGSAVTAQNDEFKAVFIALIHACSTSKLGQEIQ